MADGHAMLRLFDAHCHLQVSRGRKIISLWTFMLTGSCPLAARPVTMPLNIRLWHVQDARIGCSVAKVIKEAQNAGVKKFACNGCWEGDWEKVCTRSMHLYTHTREIK